MSKRVAVVAAAIVRDGLIFCAQRSRDAQLPDVWEFPGGKIEQGETAKEALLRELREELALHIVEIGPELATTHHEYPFGDIALTTFVCALCEGEAVLNDHQAAAWLKPSELTELEWAPADLPAVEALRELLVDGRLPEEIR